jgi:hypothetical protein
VTKQTLANKSVMAGVAKQFHDLGHTLGQDFHPQIESLITSLVTALHYLNQVAHLPLDKAFQSLATKGVHLLDKFVRGVGSAISEPIRLAIKVAFGKNSGLQGALQGWWDSARAFLFGEVSKHPLTINLGRGHKSGGGIVLGKPQAGALQPLIQWFGRQHFEKTGGQWAQSIVNGVTAPGGVWDHLKPFVVKVADTAGTAAGKAFTAAFVAEATQLVPAVADIIANLGSQGVAQSNTGAHTGGGTYHTHTVP